jgi:hypothetical protein
MLCIRRIFFSHQLFRSAAAQSSSAAAITHRRASPHISTLSPNTLSLPEDSGDGGGDLPIQIPSE